VALTAGIQPQLHNDAVPVNEINYKTQSNNSQSLQMLRFHTNESVSSFLPANQHNYAIQCHSLWFMLESTPDRRQIKNKNNTEKPNNTKHSKTKLPRFSRLL